MIKATIIGAGKVGTTIALKLQTYKECDFELIYKSEDSKAKAIESGVNSDNLKKIENATFGSRIIIIAVRDNEIETVVNQLKENYRRSIEDKIIFHTSGTMTKATLEIVKAVGCRIAAAHPYQTFYNQNHKILNGITWGIEAEDDTYNEISYLIKLLGGNAVKLSQETIDKKSLYHISAVAASNFMTLSIELAKQIALDAGIDANEFMPEILRTTLQNNLDQLVSDTPAITGPVVRGEVDTLRKHIDDLGESMNGVIYRNLSESLALMAFEKGLLTGDRFEQIIEILDK